MTDEPGTNNCIDIETKKTWDGFSNWFHCICVVTFDLELGQALEVPFHI